MDSPAGLASVCSIRRMVALSWDALDCRPLRGQAGPFRALLLASVARSRPDFVANFSPVDLTAAATNAGD